MRFFLALFMASSFFISSASEACTLWASLGSVNQSDQLLFVKNRDAPLQSLQELQLIDPPEGYRYLALMYKDQPNATAFNFISAGINSYGLNVADNDIHVAQAFGDDVGSAIMRNILQHYRSVAEVLRDQQQLFSHGASQNLMIADTKQILMVEIAPAGHYALTAIDQPGYLTHTNHYLNAELIPYNDPVSLSTFMRYSRINELLSTSTQPFDVAGFKVFARDQSALKPDGSIDTNNSILRKVTQATWIVAIPKDGVPVLWLQQFNPNQAKRDLHFVLSPAFWQQKL